MYENIAKIMSDKTGKNVNPKLIVHLPTDERCYTSCYIDVYAARYAETTIVAYMYYNGDIDVNVFEP